MDFSLFIFSYVPWLLMIFGLCILLSYFSLLGTFEECTCIIFRKVVFGSYVVAINLGTLAMNVICKEK